MFPILETFPCPNFLLELTTFLPPIFSKLLKRVLHSLFQVPGSQLTSWAGFHFLVLNWSTLDKVEKGFLKPDEVDLVISFPWIFLLHLTPSASRGWKPLCWHCALLLLTRLSDPSFSVLFIISWLSLHSPHPNIGILWGLVFGYFFFSYYILSLGDLITLGGSTPPYRLMTPDLYIQPAVVPQLETHLLLNSYNNLMFHG